MIHLELLARHKGSVLGNYPGEVRPMLLLRSWSWLIFFQVQPSQKLFESQLFHLLQFEMDPSKIIWLEYESFKIGNITVPKVKHVMMTLMPGMICLFAESFQQDGWVGPSPHWGNPRWSGVLYPAGKPSAILRRLEEEKTSKLNQDLQPPTFIRTTLTSAPILRHWRLLCEDLTDWLAKRWWLLISSICFITFHHLFPKRNPAFQTIVKYAFTSWSQNRLTLLLLD